MEGAKRGRGIGESKRHNKIKRPFISKVAAFLWLALQAKVLTCDRLTRRLGGFRLAATCAARKIKH